MKNEFKFIKEEIKNFFKSLSRIFIYKKKHKIYTTKKILVAGGYGNGNVGDEAQCNATLEMLLKRYPDYQIINLTPDIIYSKKEHPEYNHDFASRVLLFNNRRACDCYILDNSCVKKMFFLLKSFLIFLNGYLVRAEFPTFLINARTAKFLYELKECSLFYFCGGGYLTGSTLSRLWEGILICRLAHVFKTPVVMSGQTIGIWGNNFNKIYSKWGFRHVETITVRDEEYSLNDLKEIGIFGKNCFATHDDALHCKKSIERQIRTDKYITINFHYWGMANKIRGKYIDKIHAIIKHIENTTECKIIFIPMHSTDEDSFNDYLDKYPSENIEIFKYDYDFKKIRRVIADSKMCITMKHHPIIFAMGENVPTISLAYSDYYIHKNVGALAQYGQSKFSLDLTKEKYFDDFIQLFNEAMNNSSEIRKTIKEKIRILDKRKNAFLNEVDNILKN